MKLEFDSLALEDLHWWKKNDKKKAIKIFNLLEEIVKTPYSGTGKPEPLKYSLSGCWSRRIDREHRLVYKVENDTIIVLACKYHYK